MRQNNDEQNRLRPTLIKIKIDKNDPSTFIVYSSIGSGRTTRFSFIGIREDMQAALECGNSPVQT